MRPGTVEKFLTPVYFRAERQCPGMDDDSLDELVDRSPGPAGRRRLSPAALASSAGEPVSHPFFPSPGGAQGAAARTSQKQRGCLVCRVPLEGYLRGSVFSFYSFF